MRALRRAARGGPYRARLIPADDDASFWRSLERRRRLGRFLPLLPFVLALILPGLALATHLATEPEVASSTGAVGRIVVDPRTESWGLEVAPHRTAEWRGPLPIGIHHPGPGPSSVPLATIHAGLAAQAADPIARCYRRALEADPELGGVVIAHIAVRDRRVKSVVSGPRSLRRAVGDCVEHAIQSVPFSPIADIGWGDLPIRFSPR